MKQPAVSRLSLRDSAAKRCDPVRVVGLQYGSGPIRGALSRSERRRTLAFAIVRRLWLSDLAIAQITQDFQHFAPCRKLTAATTLVVVNGHHEFDLFVLVIAFTSGGIDLSSPFNLPTVILPSIYPADGGILADATLSESSTSVSAIRRQFSSFDHVILQPG